MYMAKIVIFFKATIHLCSQLRSCYQGQEEQVRQQSGLECKKSRKYVVAAALKYVDHIT